MVQHLTPLRRKAIALGSAVLLTASLAACATPNAASSPSSTAPTSATGAPAAKTHKVTNAEHELVFHVVDGTLPALVLDAGGGLSSSYWKDLAPRLAKATGSKVVTYDRAGEGESDEVSGPWRVENAVSDLEAGLRQLGVTKDVVLVSHSIAGEVATNFVNKNPGWVSGAVLVDANVPDFFSDEMLTAFEPVIEKQRIALLAQASTKKNRQLLAVMVDYAPVHRAFHRLAWPKDVPVTVIVASETPFADSPDAAKLWRDAQVRFAQAGPGRKHVVAENTSHEGIVTERPDIITGAVDDVLKTIR
ncbi:Alpha/beta hydrolase family protein [Lentzea waywayandensis]|uniref:Alpha/beta hydrolase family protein n=1 Tax=Lentzea waywayandensis TaxID=84724 RepID=A0A1I6DEH3_9PSEU|nr:alpha/beta hydrolase [Lentzea waywayandensis]SFR03890.1 Alpha/beta hydrolase family protein [Lentzea waywayandensis]